MLSVKSDTGVKELEEELLGKSEVLASEENGKRIYPRTKKSHQQLS